MASRIEDYALIGDRRSVALVARNGSIDWLCLPRFDSRACFAALLGSEEHGHWLVAPASPIESVSRRYRGESLVLETEYRTRDGVVCVVDCMPPRSDRPDVVRRVVCKSGRVRMRMDLVIRFDYGSSVPWTRCTRAGAVAVTGPETLYLETPVQLEHRNRTLTAEFEVAEGEAVPFVLTWYESHDPPAGGVEAAEAIELTERYWKEWSCHCSLGGPYREAVIRSLVTLKALTYAPTGGIAAAATTSLPEHLGGARNWDYRYCWLRDATFTLYAFLNSGFEQEARDFREWLLRAVAGAPSQMQIMYGLAGERWLPEVELDWLPGYEGSFPVRVGNHAHRQRQIDVYGQVMDALHLARRSGIDPSDDAWEVQRALVEHLEQVWDQPDHGIWEVRGDPRQFTFSKLMAWVGLDRAVKDARTFGLAGPVDHWVELRDRIRADLCRHGVDERRGCFTQAYGSRALDASMLLVPLVGFLPAEDPRVRATVAAIEEELMIDGLVRRYLPSEHLEGVPGDEGAFLLCSFWMADNWALAGRRADARRLFEWLLSLRNDVGLLAEQYDPRGRRMLGNFPQAYSHVALVNTAYNLVGQRKPAEEIGK